MVPKIQIKQVDTTLGNGLAYSAPSNMALPTDLLRTYPDKTTKNGINFINHHLRNGKTLHLKLGHVMRYAFDQSHSAIITQELGTPMVNSTNNLVNTREIMANI